MASDKLMGNQVVDGQLVGKQIKREHLTVNCVTVYQLLQTRIMTMYSWYVKKKLKNFMAPFFYGWGSTASRLEPLRGGSLLFTTKFPEVPGTHSIDLGRMKG